MCNDFFRWSGKTFQEQWLETWPNHRILLHDPAIFQDLVSDDDSDAEVSSEQPNVDWEPVEAENDGVCSDFTKDNTDRVVSKHILQL